MRALSVVPVLAFALAMPLAAQTRSADYALRGDAVPAPVEEASIADLSAMLASGRETSDSITRAYLARIAAMDRAGPTLRAIIATNPDAVGQARAADARRKAGRAIGPLDGIPILIKDNIETIDPMATTAGSLALKDNVTRRDAPVVALLRRAGAVILGKTNLSEWANFRSSESISGWSAVGGLVRNPYALDRTACGSSSGSGAAVAASFAAAAIGTETDGSVVCPAAMNGLVGLKPTVGLVSRSYIVPISRSQDTPGPMARSVRDVAVLFSAMIGVDTFDPATQDAARHARAYAKDLSADGLKGVRVGVLHPDMTPALKAKYDAQLIVLKKAGAILVDVEQPKLEGLGDAEFDVLKTEFKAGLDAYLAGVPQMVKTRNLDQLIAFNAAHMAEELQYFGQETFEQSAKTRGVNDAEYLGARAKARRLAGAEGIDAMLATAKATILVSPSYGLPWLSDAVGGDHFTGPSASEMPAVAGYPHLTVPMGLVKGLPVGLSFIATAYGDGDVLKAGYAYEQASKARVAPKYLPVADVGAGLDGDRP